MTTLLLATTGGHLAQLHGLSTRLPADGATVWVTHANEQSVSLLAEQDVEFVPYVGVRSVRGVLRCLPTAHRLWRRRKITRAVSTGSAIALGYLPYLAARGVECHYIESATRVSGPSLTGRVLQWVPGVHLYTQHPRWADRRWRYGGSEFDRYQPVAAARRLGERVRVVVTVGSATDFPFRRLIMPLVQLLAPNGPLHQATGRDVEVLWQTGDTPVDDLRIQPRPFLPARELSAALAEADIVVCHAGTGSALAVLGAGRLPLLVPRLRRYGEAVDDHQRELAAELSRRGLAVCREADEITVDDLLATLDRSVRSIPNPAPFNLRS
ncbi:glycosyltransferase [Gandjariella thermophila]|uniref:Glycosyl transferase n=1 Tax=Gandjariella thermophila TaxID=1931992 RepID=A0A4D4J929_9PSEU|nr:glycosyltransferase [Gandjariella thermophila]GDY32044.1 glycosyl transferase [Gandjariella thermophila]